MGDDGRNHERPHEETTLNPMATEARPDPPRPGTAGSGATGRTRTGPMKPADDLEAVFREHSDLVLRAAYRITGSMADAEDVLQTVFFRLLRREDEDRLELDPAQGAGSYLRRAAINAALDVVRSRKRQRAVSIDGDQPPRLTDDAPDAERRRAGTEAHAAVRRALAETVTPKAAEVFALRYFEGLANKEIARQLAKSQTAVAVTLHRTRSRLRQELGSTLGGLS